MNRPAGSFQGRPIVAQHAGVTVTVVGAHLGAEITASIFRKSMSDEVHNAIEGALAENELLVFRNQDISSQNLIDFGSRFGELTVHPFAPKDKDVSVLIKFRNDETNPPFRTDVWHSDETFRKDQPKATMHASQGSAGDRRQHDVRQHVGCFDGLSDRMQQIVGLEQFMTSSRSVSCLDDSEEDRKNIMRWEMLYPPAVHPVVRVTRSPAAKYYSSIRSSRSRSRTWTSARARRCSTSCSSRRKFRNISSWITGRRTR